MKIILILIAVGAVLVGGFFALNTYIYNEKQAPNEEPVVGRYMDIETYVRTNISTLSPEKEVLGGTFYVTAIETDGSTGVVSYEDGHIAFTADFTYTISEEGRPTVTSFVIREEY